MKIVLSSIFHAFVELLNKYLCIKKTIVDLRELYSISALRMYEKITSIYRMTLEKYLPIIKMLTNGNELDFNDSISTYFEIAEIFILHGLQMLYKLDD